MAKMKQETIQTNIHTHDFDDLTKYSLMMGGLNVTNASLQQYDPLKTGFGRLFMIRTPKFLTTMLPTKTKKFKHILEYANTAVGGFNDIQWDMAQIQGGYVGKQFDVGMVAKDDMSAFTVSVYEFSGSPVREYITTWISGCSDLMTGLSHYHGVDLPIHQANHSSEFIYVATDQTGVRIEYACMLANCMPKNIKLDQFNYESGSHDLVKYDIEFTCVRYESPQINEVAKALLNKYNVLMNYLDFQSGFTTDDVSKLPDNELKDVTEEFAWSEGEVTKGAL